MKVKVEEFDIKLNCSIKIINETKKCNIEKLETLADGISWSKTKINLGTGGHLLL